MNTEIAPFRLNVIPLALVLALAGCAAVRNDQPKPVVTSLAVISSIVGRQWKLDRWVSSDGKAQDPGPVDLVFNKKDHVAGFSGVNRYFGPIAFTPQGGLDLTQGLASTMMAGTPAAMTRERLYLRDLGQVRRARLDHGRLVLTGAGPLRLEFAPKRQ